MEEAEEEDETLSIDSNMNNNSSSSSNSSSSTDNDDDDSFSYQGSVDTVYSFQVQEAAPAFVSFGSNAFFSISVKQNSKTEDTTTVEDAAAAEDITQVNKKSADAQDETKLPQNSEQSNLDIDHYNDSDDENGTFFIYRHNEYDIHPDPHVVTKIKVHKCIGTEIPNRAFRNCQILTLVKLPQNSGITKIGMSAFEDCCSLVDIELPTTIQEIKTNAFWSCKSLRTLKLPKGLTIIGIGAFAYCMSLETMEYPSTLKEIRDGAFHWNSALTTVYLQEGLKRIGKDAFSHCQSLVNVNIPRTVKQIATGCFDGCSQLRSVELSPSSLQRIGNYAFHMCESLRVIYFPHPVDNGAFMACQDLQVMLQHHLDTTTLDNDEAAITDLMQDWIGRLVARRWEDLPLHRLCYKQACESANNQVTHGERIAHVLQQQQEYKDVALVVDRYGMTALHILALSVKPNVTLLEQIFPVYPKSAVLMQDQWSTTPLEYLCHNRALGIQTLLQCMMEWGFDTRIQHLGLVQWKQQAQLEMDEFVTSDLFGGQINNNTTANETLVADRKGQLHDFLLKLLTLERLEALSLLECALWKSKLHQEMQAFGGYDMNIAEDRSFCRFRCGADVVIVNVLGFLGQVTIPAVSNLH